jgi:DNA-binding NtrC family response regulator
MSKPKPPTVVITLEQLEKFYILTILSNNSNDKVKTSKELGISLKTLYNKLSKYGRHSVKSRRA